MGRILIDLWIVGGWGDDVDEYDINREVELVDLSLG